MPFDALTLDCFIAVAQTGSFTRGAIKVSRTQSAVSQQISKLEEKIGRSLFVRARRLTLTEDGEMLLYYAKKIIELNREAMDCFTQPDLKGEVIFGLPEDFASVFLSDVLKDFIAMHPRVTLKIECDLTVNLYNKFKENHFDIVLVKMNRPEELPNGIDVWTEGLVWVGKSSSLELPYDRPVPLILSPQPCVYRASAIRSLEQQNKKWNIVFSSHSHAGTIAAVRAGMGITVLPQNMVPKDLEIIRSGPVLPALDSIHVSLLKHDINNIAVDSLEEFVMNKLKGQ